MVDDYIVCIENIKSKTIQTSELTVTTQVVL